MLKSLTLLFAAALMFAPGALAEPVTTTVVPQPTYQAPTYTQEQPAYTPQPTYTQAPLPTYTQPPQPTATQAPEPTYVPPSATYSTPAPVSTPEPTYTQTKEVPVSTPSPTAAPSVTETQAPLPTPSGAPLPTPSASAPLPTPSATPIPTPSAASPSVSTPAISGATATPSGSSSATPSESSVSPTLTSSPTAQSSVVATTVSGTNTVVTTLSSTPQASIPVVSSSPTKAADPAAVEEAKNAPPVYVDPVLPPPPPPAAVNIDFNTVVNNTVIVNNTVNNTVINNWTYLDYDDWNRPVVYNPYPDPFGFRYWYDGDYRTVWVQPGARIVINLTAVGVFPFTAVSINNVVSVGYFNGGCWNPPPTCLQCGPPPGWVPPAPTIYTNVNANVIAVNKTVAVSKVIVVGKDEKRPAGQQDIFMLDDTTLAWGQVVDGRNGGAINIAETQATPGVGPIDNGVRLVNATQDTNKPSSTWPWLVGIVALLAGLSGLAYWIVKHPRGNHVVGG